MQNRYFVCPPEDALPVEWNPFNHQEFDDPKAVYPDYPLLNYDYPDITYLSGALRALERDYTLSGYTFYLTKDVQSLPSYGPKVIAFLVADERCRRPAYLGRVGAIFRNYGVRPRLARGAHKHTALSLPTLYQFVRMHMFGLRGRVSGLAREFAQRLGWGGPRCATAQHVIPNGYYNQLPLPLKDLSSRPVDLYFSGSIGAKYWFSAKRASRERMLARASVLARSRPDLAAKLEAFPDFIPETFRSPEEKRKAAEDYSQALMDAKICLVPRGTMPESARFFEALRFGCIIICDPLPDHWFYRDAPVIQLKSWHDLGDVVTSLFEHPERMLALHERSLEHWRAVCSERALGAFVAEALGAQLKDPSELSETCAVRS